MFNYFILGKNVDMFAVQQGVWMLVWMCVCEQGIKVNLQGCHLPIHFIHNTKLVILNITWCIPGYVSSLKVLLMVGFGNMHVMFESGMV